MDRDKVIECLQKAKMVIETWVPMFEQYNTPAGIDDAIILLKEQEAEIRQLRLALDIAKGTCKGIAFKTDEKFMGDL